MTTETYENLASKYRPQTLDAVVGQDVAVAKLEGMLSSKKIHRAILISGTYGSGKTSLARIIARNLNCKNGPAKSCYDTSDVEPCKSCKMSLTTHPDYIEVNAANSRGIDDIRELIERSQSMPTNNYRVICIDEAHQITGAGIQALLKPLEEPAKRTVWILCTTERGKILPTIRSRCFDIEVRSVDVATTGKLVRRIAKKEGLKLTEEVTTQLASSVYGHPRSALNALEGVLQYVQSKGKDKLEEAITQAIAEVGKVSPHAAAEKYIRQVLDGSHLALNTCGQVEAYDYFLQVVCEIYDSLLLALVGSDRGNASYRRILETTAWKREFSLENLADLAQIQGILLTTSKEMKQYLVDSGQLLNFCTLSALAITQKWPTKK